MLRAARALLGMLIVGSFVFFPAMGWAKGGTIVYGTTDKIESLDPVHVYGIHALEIISNVYPSLFKIVPGTLKVSPDLAESYTSSKDFKEYTIHLRKGLKFPDGTPFDAKVVKWCIDRHFKINGPLSFLVSMFVDRLEIVSPYEVKFFLKRPVSFFPAVLTHGIYAMVNPNQYPLDKAVDYPTELKGGKMAGLGPYNIVGFKRDEEAILEANPNYHGQQPKTDRIIIRYFADATTMRLALENDEVDLVYKKLNPQDVNDLLKSKKFTSFESPSPYIRYITFLCVEPPFNEKSVRQAIAAAIDRAPIIQKVFLGQMRPLYSMLADNWWGYIPAFKTAYGDGNIAKAKELLASRGFNINNKLSFELWYSPSHYGDTERDLAAMIKAQLEGTGVINVDVKSAEWATFSGNMNKKQYQAMLQGFGPDYVDPDAFLGLIGTIGNEILGSYYANKEWETKLEEAATAKDLGRRKVLYEWSQRDWAVEVPMMPLSQEAWYVIGQKGVEGVKFQPTGALFYGDIKRVK